MCVVASGLSLWLSCPSAPDNMFAMGKCSAIIKGELYIISSKTAIISWCPLSEISSAVRCTDDIAVVLLNVRPLKSDAAHTLSRNVHRVPVSPSAFSSTTENIHLRSIIGLLHWSQLHFLDFGCNLLKQVFPLPPPPSPATITLCFSPNLPFYRRGSRKLYKCLKPSFLKFEKELTEL